MAAGISCTGFLMETAIVSGMADAQCNEPVRVRVVPRPRVLPGTIARFVRRKSKQPFSLPVWKKRQGRGRGRVPCVPSRRDVRLVPRCSAHVPVPVAIVMPGVFMPVAIACAPYSFPPCRSRGRACLPRKGARGGARATRSSPPEQADSHARAGQVLQEERRCDCGTSALVKLILVGRHSYSRATHGGCHNLPFLLVLLMASTCRSP